VSDSEIVELDEPEPVTARDSPRLRALAIVLAPLVAIVAIAVAVSTAGPAVTPVATTQPTGPSLVLLTAIPIPTIAPTPLAAPVEIARPEVLLDRQWVTRGPAHPARSDVAEAVLDGAIYVIGGTGTTEDGTHVFRHEPSTGARARAPDLPISLDHAMAATLGDRIYVMGGYVFGQPSARVFSLSARDASWVVESLMPQGRAAGGAVVLNGRIWLVGGVSLNGAWIPEVWSWDGKGRWTTGLAPMPTPRDHLAVATYRGSICAAGGNGGERAFECYEPARNQWSKLPDLRRPVIAARAAELAGWFWVVAVDLQVYNADRWYFAPPPQSLRGGLAMAVIDDALYIVEGATGFAVPMEMFRPVP